MRHYGRVALWFIAIFRCLGAVFTEEILLLMVVVYSVSLVFGYLLEKYFRMPWMFASLFFGLGLSATGLFKSAVESEVFKTLESIGMFFLLFLIGFNLNLSKIERLKKYFLTGALSIVAFEGLFVSLVLYFIFPATIGYSYPVALITALSFATVGEAVLLPILSEFKIVKTDFGQLTLGIGTLDDVIEVLMLASVAVMPSFVPRLQVQSLPPPEHVFLGLAVIATLAFILLKLGKIMKSLFEKNNPPPFVYFTLTMLTCFSFITLGYHFFESLAAVGAIFGGMVLRGILPKEKLYQNERAVEFLGYVFLSPIFFCGVGAAVSLSSVFSAPLLITTVAIATVTAKCAASFLVLRRLLGAKFSLLAGLGLSVRFSTGLVVQLILLKSGLISLALYSALVTTAIVLNPIIITVYSWKLAREKPP